MQFSVAMTPMVAVVGGTGKKLRLSPNIYVTGE